MAPDGIAVLYTDFESDDRGPYTTLIGALVAEVPTELPDGLLARSTPAGQYQRFTSSRGPLAQTTMALWQQIWKDDELRTRRSFAGDLELYDERAQDPTNAQFDVLIALK